ncbi:MAG: ADP-ribosylation factor-like protein [Promethearchaeota archaeon]
MQNKKLDASKKIVLLGLDNSGKSSIVKCLKGIKNLASFNTPKPTRGHKINRFNMYGTNFSIWDFGGQSTFRDELFINFRSSIKETDKIIFVIDIQDQERYETSLEYLTKLNSLIQKHHIVVELSIFLHKFDPDLESITKINEETIEKLINKIRDKVPSDIPYKIFKTSIYTVFQKLSL